MSYILEALKKSRQERGASDAHFLDIPQEFSAVEPPAAKIPSVFLWLAGLIVLCALLGLALLLSPPEDSEESVDVSAQASGSDLNSGFVHADQAESQIAKTVADIASDTAPDIEAEIEAEIPLIPTPRVRAVSDSSIPRNETSSANSEVKIQNTGRADEVAQQEVSPADSEAITTVKEPESKQEEPEESAPRMTTRTLPPLSSMRKIPDLIFTSHVYSESDPSSRSVGINEGTYYEGDMIAPEVILDEITAKGVLLSVDGYALPVNHRTGWQAIGS